VSLIRRTSVSRIAAFLSFFVYLLSQFGQTVIEAQAAKLYTKKVNGTPVEKGVAFPVCISVNDIVCNHSPLSSEEVVRADRVFEAACSDRFQVHRDCASLS
jgi:hypothetical protein